MNGGNEVARGTFATGVFDGSAAEIVDLDAKSRRAFVTNAEETSSSPHLLHRNFFLTDATFELLHVITGVFVAKFNV